MGYQVVITAPAEEAMHTRAIEIAQASGSVDVARQWLQSILQKTERLAIYPESAELAEESIAFDFEIRKLLVGNYLVLYRINHDKRQVIIVGFRHGAKLNTDFDDPINYD